MPHILPQPENLAPGQPSETIRRRYSDMYYPDATEVDGRVDTVNIYPSAIFAGLALGVFIMTVIVISV